MPVKRVKIVRKIVSSPLLVSLGAFVENKKPNKLNKEKKNIDNVRQIPNKTLYICILKERPSAKECNGMVKRQYNELLCSYEDYKAFYLISSR